MYSIFSFSRPNADSVQRCVWWIRFYYFKTQTSKSRRNIFFRSNFAASCLVLGFNQTTGQILAKSIPFAIPSAWHVVGTNKMPLVGHLTLSLWKPSPLPTHEGNLGRDKRFIQIDPYYGRVRGIDSLRKPKLQQICQESLISAMGFALDRVGFRNAKSVINLFDTEKTW